MRSAIFSIASGIALTLLMRGPAPTPPTLPQQCAAPAATAQYPADAITARVIDALRDSLPVWLAGQDSPGIAVERGDRTMRRSPTISTRDGYADADTCRCRDRLPAATTPPR